MDIVNILNIGLFGSPWFCVSTPNFTHKEKNKYITATKEEMKGWDKEDLWAHILSNGGFIEVEDVRKETTHFLTLEKIKIACEILKNAYPQMYVNIMEENGDFRDNDAVIQIAIFGDIIYSNG